MIFLDLAEAQASVTQAHIGSIVFQGGFEVGLPLDVVPLGLFKYEGVLQGIQILLDRFIAGIGVMDGTECVGQLPGIGQRTDAGRDHVRR